MHAGPQPDTSAPKRANPAGILTQRVRAVLGGKTPACRSRKTSIQGDCVPATIHSAPFPRVLGHLANRLICRRRRTTPGLIETIVCVVAP